jgi:hypothetical protein
LAVAVTSAAVPLLAETQAARTSALQVMIST